MLLEDRIMLYNALLEKELTFIYLRKLLGFNPIAVISDTQQQQQCNKTQQKAC